MVWTFYRFEVAECRKFEKKSERQCRKKLIWIEISSQMKKSVKIRIQINNILSVLIFISATFSPHCSIMCTDFFFSACSIPLKCVPYVYLYAHQTQFIYILYLFCLVACSNRAKKNAFFSSYFRIVASIWYTHSLARSRTLTLLFCL